MVDSGDAALAGAVAGGVLTYAMTDGDTRYALLGAGAGLVVSGQATEDVLGQAIQR